MHKYTLFSDHTFFRKDINQWITKFMQANKAKLMLFALICKVKCPSQLSGHLYLRVNLYKCQGGPTIFAPSDIVVQGHFHIVSVILVPSKSNLCTFLIAVSSLATLFPQWFWRHLKAICAPSYLLFPPLPWLPLVSFLDPLLLVSKKPWQAFYNKQSKSCPHFP